jgi:hypothetical protein
MEIGAEVVDGGAIEVGDGDEVPDALQPARPVGASMDDEYFVRNVFTQSAAASPG